MRDCTLGLLAVALLCVTGASIASPIVYNVDISDEKQSLTGTITTTGALGPIYEEDITAWSFTAIGQANFSIISDPPQSDPGPSPPATLVAGLFCGEGGGYTCFVASPSALRFDFSGQFTVTGFSLFSADPTVRFGAQVIFLADRDVFPGPGGAVRMSHSLVDLNGTRTFYIPVATGLRVIAVAVPEPSTGLVLCLGLAGLGFACKRLRVQQATAV